MFDLVEAGTGQQGILADIFIRCKNKAKQKCLGLSRKRRAPRDHGHLHRQPTR